MNEFGLQERNLDMLQNKLVEKIHKWLPWQRSDIVTRSWTKMRPDPLGFK
jgi:hypothetical protein